MSSISLKIIFTITALVVSCFPLEAQENSESQVEGIKKTMQETKENFKEIFKGKKNTNTGQSQEKERQQSSNKPTSQTNSTSSTIGNGKAGTIHPDKKILSGTINSLTDFTNGVIAISNGSMHSLINSKGEQILPFQSQGFYTGELNTVSNNFFLTYINSQKILVNTNGKILANYNTLGVINSRATSYDEKYTGLKDTKSQYMIVINGDGIQYKLTNPEGSILDDKVGMISDGLVLMSKKVGNVGARTNVYLYGYKNLKNEWVVQPQYDYLEPYSEGLAVAGKYDEFGTLKYGFIDKTGKVVIPYKYSNKPGPFSCGRALIIPPINSTSGVEYAYINSSGSVIIEVLRSDRHNKAKPNESPSNFFRNGYYLGDPLYVFDTLGKSTTVKEYLKSIGLPEQAKIILPNSKRDSPYTGSNSSYFFYSIVDSKTNEIKVGIYWMDSKKSLPPIFTTLRDFDPVSQLAYARLRVKGGEKADAFIEGYINEEGVFMLVKELPSEW